MSKKPRGKYLAGHQRSWLWGRHPVMEVLEAGNWPVLELYLSDSLPCNVRQHAEALAIEQGAVVAIVAAERIQELGHIQDHQGFLARMGTYAYAGMEDALLYGKDNPRDDGFPPLYLILDAVQDTFNFGAIIRSAEAMGARAIFVGENNQAPVNSLVARTSAGAVNRIPIVQVPDLAKLAGTLKLRGIQIIGADEKKDHPCSQCDLNRPTAVILGNEGRGICSDLAVLCDTFACIPMTGEIASLNVGAAAAVLLYEAWRQKHT